MNLLNIENNVKHLERFNNIWVVLLLKILSEYCSLTEIVVVHKALFMLFKVLTSYNLNNINEYACTIERYKFNMFQGKYSKCYLVRGYTSCPELVLRTGLRCDIHLLKHQ